jgi:hypothetical protein
MSNLVDAAVAEISRDQRLAWCEAIDGVATDHAKVISATAGVYDGSSRSASVSSNGFSGMQQSTYCWYGSEITLRDATSAQRTVVTLAVRILLRCPRHRLSRARRCNEFCHDSMRKKVQR